LHYASGVYKCSWGYLIAIAMLSSVKYIFSAPKSSLNYETCKEVDTEVTHTSYSTLREALYREGMHLIAIHQGTLEIDNDESYSRLNTEKRMSALYRRANIIAFQG
jgi:hypothetical protein